MFRQKGLNEKKFQGKHSFIHTFVYNFTSSEQFQQQINKITIFFR